MISRGTSRTHFLRGTAMHNAAAFKSNRGIGRFNVDAKNHLRSSTAISHTSVRNYVITITSENEHLVNVEKIKKEKIPKEDIVLPVEYDGPETLRVAYVLDRIPLVSRDQHPIELAWEDYSSEYRSTTARHTYPEFWEFFNKWKPVYEQQTKEQNKQKKKKKKKTQEKKEVRGPEDWIKLPNEPQSELEKHRWVNKTGEKLKEEKRFIKLYRPPPRFTQDDYDDNRKSFNRKLDRRLFFIVKNPKTGLWEFPSGIRSNPLTMRQAAENLYKEHFASKGSSFFVSNAPVGHWVDPKNELDKTFFYHCLHMDGSIPEGKWDDWALVSRSELRDYDMAEGYKRVAQSMLWEGYEGVGE